MRILSRLRLRDSAAASRLRCLRASIRWSASAHSSSLRLLLSVLDFFAGDAVLVIKGVGASTARRLDLRLDGLMLQLLAVGWGAGGGVPDMLLVCCCVALVGLKNDPHCPT